MWTKEKQALVAKPTNEIIVYQPDETVRLEVRLENDMVWLNRNQMAELFGRDVKTIGKHIANALKEELNPDFLPNRLGDEVGVNHDNPVVANFATTARDGKKYRVEYYNLEMIVSVGFRVKSPQGVIFRRWANTVLREYLLRGYAFNTRINQLEDKMDRRLAQHDADIGELKDKVDFFVKTSLPPVQGVFYDGQVFDARVFATKHILSAKKSILLIDSWVGVGTLEILAKKGGTVSVEIVTSPRGNKLAASDIAKFNAQYGGLTVRTSAKFHDRFLVIDNRRLYLIGASLKDLGWKCFAFTQLDASEIVGLKARI